MSPRSNGSDAGKIRRNLNRAERNGPTIGLPVVGKMTLPPVEHLAWYAAIGALAAIELIEWPVALIVAAGKALADNRHSATLRNIGDALEDAG